MAKTKPIPVRLSDDDIQRLDEAAESMGTNRAALIRYCADTFARYIIKVGKAALPLNWREILQVADGRTREARDAETLAVVMETTSNPPVAEKRKETTYQPAKRARKKKS